MPPPDCVKSTKGLFEWLSHSTCSAFRHSDCPNTAVCLLLHNLSGWPRGRCFMVFRRVPQIHHSQCDIFVSRRVVTATINRISTIQSESSVGWQIIQRKIQGGVDTFPVGQIGRRSRRMQKGSEQSNCQQVGWSLPLLANKYFAKKHA